ncbi:MULTISPECIES: hypothetical protein [unclassified Streptomyces]|uniref:hypothetical protein n=1 Tax=unclassified Streptomyces TaxID=2593676 RepID=UPI0036E7544F
MPPPAIASERTRQLRRVALSGMLGTAVEFSTSSSTAPCGGSLSTALTVWFVRETSRASLAEEPTPELPTTPHTEEKITA